MRTFTAQIEALTKLRRGGEQVVRHIHVDNRGGQAVITETVQTGGSRNGKVADQSHATGFEDASGPALLGQDETWHGVPIAGGEGPRSEEHTSELQSLMRISYAVFCLKKKNKRITTNTYNSQIHRITTTS